MTKSRAEIQAAYRRRQAIRAESLRVDLPEDVVRELEAKGIDVRDPMKLGSLIEDAVEGVLPGNGQDDTSWDNHG